MDRAVNIDKVVFDFDKTEKEKAQIKYQECIWPGLVNITANRTQENKVGKSIFFNFKARP